MARIPFVTPNDVPANERSAFDRFVQIRAGVPAAGPYALLLRMPEVAQRVESLRLCLRDEATLPQKLQELIMITVAREMDCAYIWHAHAAAALAIGVRGDVIDNLRERRALTGLKRINKQHWISPANCCASARSTNPPSIAPARHSGSAEPWR